MGRYNSVEVIESAKGTTSESRRVKIEICQIYYFYFINS